MGFTNVWNDAFPPDTQLANLLGSDLRAFRVDVQQRMSAISGLDAAKPTFNLDNTPANWNGILFFATDTGKIYQFNSPVWTNVTPNFATGFQSTGIIKAVTPVNVVNPAVTTIGQGISIPGGFISTTNTVRICFSAFCNSAVTGTPQIQLVIDSQVITPSAVFAFNGDNVFGLLQFSVSNNANFRPYGSLVNQNGASINTSSLFNLNVVGNLTGAFTIKTQVTPGTLSVFFDTLSIEVF